MVFVGIEFFEADGGGVALIHEKWLTPRKKEVWWPPVKQQDHFSKALKKGDSPAANWKIYGVARTFFEEDDFTKASKKIKQAENFSDIQSEHEELPSRRPIKRRALFSETSSDEDDTPSQSKGRKVIGLDRILEKKKKDFCAAPLNTQENREISVDKKNTCQEPPHTVIQDRQEGRNNEISTIDTSNDFNRTIISYLVAIKNQNNEIIARLKEKENIQAVGINAEDFPIQLPAKTSEDINLLEEYLNDDGKLAILTSHCASFGGRDLTNRINIILKNLITNNLATEFNFCGSRGDKEAFSKLKLRTVIVNAIIQKCPSTSIQEIEDKIKIWLKHAPKRVSLERRRTVQ